MPHKIRKTRKNRGSRTHGYGRVGQHRDAGSRGFRKVGRHKHLWSQVSNDSSLSFGKHGFTSPRALHRKENVLNLNILDQISQQDPSIKKEINLAELGYTKLLGTGKVSQALTITIPSASKTAMKKIEAAGGKIITLNEAEN